MVMMVQEPSQPTEAAHVPAPEPGGRERLSWVATEAIRLNKGDDNALKGETAGWKDS